MNPIQALNGYTLKRDMGVKDVESLSFTGDEHVFEQLYLFLLKLSAFIPVVDLNGDQYPHDDEKYFSNRVKGILKGFALLHCIHPN